MTALLPYNCPQGNVESPKLKAYTCCQEASGGSHCLWSSLEKKPLFHVYWWSMNYLSSIIMYFIKWCHINIVLSSLMGEFMQNRWRSPNQCSVCSSSANIRREVSITSEWNFHSREESSAGSQIHWLWADQNLERGESATLISIKHLRQPCFQFD